MGGQNGFNSFSSKQMENSIVQKFNQMKSEPDRIVHSDCFQKSTLLQNQ